MPRFLPSRSGQKRRTAVSQSLHRSVGRSIGLYDFRLRSVLVGGVEPFGETQTGRPVLAPLQEIAAILELAVGVLAGLPARDGVIAFARRQCRDLALTSHFEPVMIDDAFGDAFAADENAVIAQDHDRSAVEIAKQLWRHVGVE